MALIDRVKGILMSPRTEWPTIAAEPATVGSLYTGYILILAAIGPVAMAIRSPIVGLGLAIVTYGISLVVTYVVALIVDALAPTFGGERNFIQSLKLTAYAHTAVWVAGVLRLIPLLGILVLVAAIYSFYTFYVGVPTLKKVPADKAVGYTVLVVVAVVVLSVVLSWLLIGLLFGGAFMAGMGAMS